MVGPNRDCVYNRPDSINLLRTREYVITNEPSAYSAPSVQASSQSYRQGTEYPQNSSNHTTHTTTDSQLLHSDHFNYAGISQPQSRPDILDSAFFKPPNFLPFRSPLEAPSTIVHRGVEVYFDTVLYHPSWERPAYRSYWDPSVSGGRWSHLPTRVHFALRRIFASPINASFVRKNRR